LGNVSFKNASFLILEVSLKYLSCRQYSRLVKGIKPNMERYEHQKQKMGEAFYSGPNTILHGLHQDSKEGIDHMVQDLEKQ